MHSEFPLTFDFMINLHFRFLNSNILHIDGYIFRLWFLFAIALAKASVLMLDFI